MFVHAYLRVWACVLVRVYGYVGTDAFLELEILTRFFYTNESLGYPLSVFNKRLYSQCESIEKEKTLACKSRGLVFFEPFKSECIEKLGNVHFGYSLD